MSTVLIIGASGPVGRAVGARLVRDANCRVLGTTRATKSSDLIALDIRNADAIEALLARTQPDIVLHLVATLDGDFDESYAVNVQAARWLLESAARCASRPRVVLLGSAAEYGAVRREENPVSEDRRLAPVSIYGATKAWQSTLAPFFAARGVQVVVARGFNFDGPGFSDRLFVGRVQKQIAELLRGERCEIELGALGATRDYIPIEDAVEQILSIAQHGVAGTVYHVASGVPVTIRDVLMRYLERSGLDASIVRSSPELSSHRGFDVPVIYADIARTVQLPGWSPRG